MSEEFTYRSAGVDIEKAASLVGDIGELRKRTEGKRSLLQAFGLFAASYDLSEYDEPVIVTGCDGVGTKLELLLAHDLLEVAGMDLVAMNVNDILTTGGDPLLFLDYIGVGRLEEEKIRRLVAGMVAYLESCDCILAGGETAEMPGVVPDGVIELSGFCIGAAEKRDLLDPTSIAEGDLVVGYPSDGFHANGWSLVRSVLEKNPDLVEDGEWKSFLAPTRLYHDVVRGLREQEVPVKAMAHITGGGLPENLERLLGDKGAHLSVPVWGEGATGRVLSFLTHAEAARTFNMGWGWVAIVEARHAENARDVLHGSRVLGEIDASGSVNVEVEA